MLEVRVHGRGGQGAVTTGQLLAIAAFHDGKYSQTFPIFGVERAGAPVEAFVRISENPINIRSQVYRPDIVMVLEPSLMETVDVTAGLKKGGSLIINTNKELKIKGDFEIHVIDATSIAMQIFQRPIVNTAVLGAFAAISKEVTLQSLEKAIDERFLKTKGEKIADLNKHAIREVYEKSR
jgi:pyruvate ferredoxin oxidoreductase gamma subunit